METLVLVILLAMLMGSVGIVMYIFPESGDFTFQGKGRIIQVGRMNYCISHSNVIGYADGREFDPHTPRGKGFPTYLSTKDHVKIIDYDYKNQDYIVELLPRDAHVRSSTKNKHTGVVFRLSKWEMKNWEKELAWAKQRLEDIARWKREDELKRVSTLETNDVDQKKWCGPDDAPASNIETPLYEDEAATLRRDQRMWDGLLLRAERGNNND